MLGHPVAALCDRDGLVLRQLQRSEGHVSRYQYCIASHRVAAVSKGMTNPMFGELMSIVGVANMNDRLATGCRIPLDEKFK